MSKINRRQLLRLGLGASASAGLGAWLLRPKTVSRANAQVAPATPRQTGNAAPATPALPTRKLGQTGREVTIFGLGGASSETPLSQGPHDEAVAIVERALALGVNYFDTATTYGNGRSERALGEVARSQRSRMFLASKTGERTYDGAMRELEGSLKRLQTDHLDLWQMHHVSLQNRDTRPAFAADGAIKALEKARSEGIVKHAGVSGHHRTDVLADWLERHPFETVLTIVNAVDRHHDDSFIERVLPVARQKKMGVIAMKIPAYGKLLRPDAGVGMREALAYSLSQSGVCCGIIACDSLAMLEANVAAARAFSPMDEAAQRALEAKTKSYWREASFYRNWT